MNEIISGITAYVSGKAANPSEDLNGQWIFTIGYAENGKWERITVDNGTDTVSTILRCESSMTITEAICNHLDYEFDRIDSCEMKFSYK